MYHGIARYHNTVMARIFVKDKPLTEEHKDSFVYGILAEYWDAVSRETLAAHYKRHFQSREVQP